MATIQRRNSQRLASALQALTADLDVDATEMQVETNENIKSGSKTPKEYMDQDGRGYGDNSEDAAKQYLGEDYEDFQSAIKQLQSSSELEEAEDDVQEASIQQGDPGVDQFGSQSTFDSQDVRDLGQDYGIDFDGDEDLESTIRNIPGRKQKQAKIKKIIARIENIANYLQKTGNKRFAYRLDIVCNNLEKKYSIK